VRGRRGVELPRLSAPGVPSAAAPAAEGDAIYQRHWQFRTGCRWPDVFRAGPVGLVKMVLSWLSITVQLLAVTTCLASHGLTPPSPPPRFRRKPSSGPPHAAALAQGAPQAGRQWEAVPLGAWRRGARPALARVRLQVGSFGAAAMADFGSSLVPREWVLVDQQQQRLRWRVVLVSWPGGGLRWHSWRS
jgi:hypothetical protein